MSGKPESRQPAEAPALKLTDQRQPQSNIGLRLLERSSLQQHGERAIVLDKIDPRRVLLREIQRFDQRIGMPCRVSTRNPVT